LKTGSVAAISAAATDRFNLLSSDLALGHVKKKDRVGWNVVDKDLDPERQYMLLYSALLQHDVPGMLRGLLPTHPQYRDLRNALSITPKTETTKLNRIRLNMDRWRWLPHDLGRMYVLVNVAGYEMAVVENNRAIEAMNVVVGKTGWETPIFADTMVDMVVNPSWHVPASIAAEEMADVSEDYLARNHFVRTSDGGYRQLPGPDNALGQFKFEFPNKDNIYLHDTPADALFSRSDRAFSHGCIRLERPRDLAYLLGEKLAGKSSNQIDRLVDTGDERVVKFRRKIPIYILYFTTWVDDNGTVRYHHDVYGHDEALQPQTQKFERRAT
ncbi:MAG TPA: L,D-transpeptidase family protein, partial [Longimicrobiales bacterium]